MANLTLSVDEKTIDRAREAATAMGTSLNQLVRDHIERLAGADQRAADHKAYEARAAAALGCPLVVLFGAMGSTRWRPRSPGTPVVALESDRGDVSKVMDIAPDDVIAGWRSLPSPT